MLASRDDVSPMFSLERHDITVKNDTPFPTSAAPSPSFDPPVGGVGDGTCDDGPLAPAGFPGDSCTVRVNISGDPPFDVTITFDAGSHSGSLVEPLTSEWR